MAGLLSHDPQDVTILSANGNCVLPADTKSIVNKSALPLVYAVDKNNSDQTIDGVIEINNMDIDVTDDEINFKETMINNEYGEVVDSGVFERTYFDDTMVHDVNDDDPTAGHKDFYGSKLSLLSSSSDQSS